MSTFWFVALATWAIFVQIVRMRDSASVGGRAREFVRMKKPGFGLWNSVVRVSMSQTVRTEMSWQVCVPVGSSSSTTKRFIGVVERIWVIWSWVSVGYSAGRLARVVSRGRTGYSRGWDIVMVAI